MILMIPEKMILLLLKTVESYCGPVDVLERKIMWPGCGSRKG